MTILSAQTIDQRIHESSDVYWFRFHGPNPTEEQKALRGERDLVIKPYVPAAKQTLGMSYGLSSCGYDIRVGKIERTAKMEPAQSWLVHPGDFILLSSLEYMELPHDIVGKVHDKSTLARKGLALQNTVLEPGWRGYITLEFSNHGPHPFHICVGQPIAQVVFEFLDRPTALPYVGKYQDQPDQPIHAIMATDGTNDTKDSGAISGRTSSTVANSSEVDRN